MMDILAKEFSQTTAGWITGILAPVLLLAIGWLARSLFARLSNIETHFNNKIEEQNDALQVQSRALAVVVSQMEPLQQQAVINRDNISGLQQITAVLQDRINRTIAGKSDLGK